ncbi:MAG: amidohydrolase family protein [Alphaproteobacteria bacterium]|nr:amidohydrolase family protein [Alphaproteobacteria bacterium]
MGAAREYKLIDGHHHLWDLARLPYAWLRPEAPPRPFGDHTKIKRNFLPADYRAATEGLDIAASVHVEAMPGAADPAAESAWLDAIRPGDGIVAASIAHLDPRSPGLDAALDALARHATVRGIRTGIAFRTNSPWRFANAAGLARSDDFRRGIARIAARDHIVEMILLPEQIVELVELADAHPRTKFVINHMATLETGFEDVWRAGVREAAKRPNIHMKLSGMWTIARDWNEAAIRVPVRFAVEAFGSTRCLWGSNLPIEGLMCGAARQFDMLHRVLGDLPISDGAAIFGGTAAQLYRIGGAARS